MKHVAALCLLAALGGCAYLNGVYNARKAEGRADALARDGKVEEARGSYATAAAKAESVLVRYPKSRWSDDALYLAGRGAALSGQCGQAVPRLGAYLAVARAPTGRRERAMLALGECLVRAGRPADALSLVVPLVHSRDRDVASASSLWAARASAQLGDGDAAASYFQTANSAAAHWDLAQTLVAQKRYASAESLLVVRGRAGDASAALWPMLEQLARAGEVDAVEQIMRTYDASRISAAARGRLHLAAADVYMEAGRDSLARAHLMAAQRVARDSLATRDATAQLTVLAIGHLPNQVDVENTIAASRDRAAGSARQRRLDDNLLLLRLLEDHNDFTGAGLFLAAEVARDSLHAPALARTLFLRLVASSPQSPLAPKALLAVAALAPDSAAAYRVRVRREYPRSPYASMIDGADASDSPAALDVEEPLRQAWTVGVAVLADSLKRLRPALPPAASAPPAATANSTAGSALPPSSATPPLTRPPS